MNVLPLKRRADILALLCEGASLRGVTRVAGVSINTVTKLLNDAGQACTVVHDERVRNVPVARLWCYKNWAPVGVRARIGKDADSPAEGLWTWSALDCD